MSEVLIFGISGDRLSVDAHQRMQSCCAVVASQRFEPLLAGVRSYRIPIAPVKTMVNRVEEALAQGDVAVLASGDPLFFGVGRTMIKHFGPDRVRIFPALSAVQLACSRFKVPWDDLTLFSLHGREPGNLAGRILPHAKVMVFTDHRSSPDRLAAELLRVLEEYGDRKRIGNIRIRVAENLGTDEEQLTCGSLGEIAAGKFSALNMMLIEQDVHESPHPIFGLQEDEIVHSRGLITKDEIRAVILHCLRLPREGVLWDVGGGSGSVSIEAARLAPDLDIYIVEKKDEEQQNIRKNIAGYALYNIHLVAGEATERLAGLPTPDRVFIGGSGGRLAEIIRQAARRLPAGGRLVASAVLEETARQAPKLMAGQGLDVEVRTVTVKRHAGQGRPENSLNPITIITGKK